MMTAPPSSTEYVAVVHWAGSPQRERTLPKEAVIDLTGESTVDHPRRDVNGVSVTADVLRYTTTLIRRVGHELSTRLVFTASGFARLAEQEIRADQSDATVDPYRHRAYLLGEEVRHR